MKAALIVVSVIVLLGYGCVKSVENEYKAQIVSSAVYDNIVPRAEADSAKCIKLNSDLESDGNGNQYNNGTFDTVDGKPVCGVRADMTTTDGKKYSVMFNRFNLDAEIIKRIETGFVGCNDAVRETCYVSDDGGSFGISQLVYKQD